MEQKRKEDLVNSDDIFKYQLLSRLQSDCEYYLGNGNRNKKQLWAEDEREQIEVMKLLYNSFWDENKPEWLSMTDIENYEKQMVVDITLEERYTVRRHIVGGTNRTLISANLPSRSCRTGTCRRLSAA